MTIAGALVLGAGPAGSVCARELVRAGLPVPPGFVIPADAYLAALAVYQIGKLIGYS